MDTWRGQFDMLDKGSDSDLPDEAAARDVPPVAIGTDERRMQVRAYNHWASLLGDGNFPGIEDLEPERLPDFGPYSVLLDFTNGLDNPGIAYLGDELAEECGIALQEMASLADVPSRSLLTRITDHYMQILANQAPIGFEAEFVNQRGKTILYRGILLPFSSDDDSIDFIYGVINWKELAEPEAADELLLEIDQALESRPASAPLALASDLTDWADGPGTLPDLEGGFVADAPEPPAPGFALTDAEADTSGDDALFELGSDMLAEPADDEASGDETDGDEDGEAPSSFASLAPAGPSLMNLNLRKKPILLAEAEPAENPFDGAQDSDYGYRPAALDTIDADFAYESDRQIVLPDIDPADMGLGDWLAAARDMAAAARNSEDRTRGALYEAIGRAYDFSLAASGASDEFAELLGDAGLTVQDRAPMTPVVKLVFGADYDKTRLTEYAAALTHAHRLNLPRGSLGDYLSQAEGGLKGVVKAERRLRREEAGQAVEDADAPRHALARKLRALPAQDFAALAPEGPEFALVMIRRTEAGEIVMMGEVPDDLALVERAARKLLG